MQIVDTPYSNGNGRTDTEGEITTCVIKFALSMLHISLSNTGKHNRVLLVGQVRILMWH